MEIKKQIQAEFEGLMENVFGEVLVFGFICGSFAKDTTTDKSDLDIFVCINKDTEKYKTRFTQWYMDVHKKYRFTPDLNYPGELMTKRRLNRALEKTLNAKPRKTVNDEAIYDGLAWSGMLYGKCVALCGKEEEYINHKAHAKKIMDKWYEHFFVDGANSSSKDIVLKKIIEYKNI